MSSDQNLNEHFESLVGFADLLPEQEVPVGESEAVIDWIWALLRSLDENDEVRWSWRSTDNVGTDEELLGAVRAQYRMRLDAETALALGEVAEGSNGEDDEDDEDGHQAMTTVKELFNGMSVPPLPPGLVAKSAFVIIKFRNSDGTPGWGRREIGKLEPEELLGALAIQAEMMERLLAEGWE